MSVLGSIRDRVRWAAGPVHRRFVGPRRHTAPLPYVACRPTTNPILPVVDMAAAIAFYERLGFVVNAYDGGYAWVTHCGWEWFHLRLVESLAENAASAYLHVDDANEWRAAMATASGGEIELAPIETMPWGKDEFSLVDPAGNLLRIGSPT